MSAQNMNITHVLFGLRTGGAELMLADIMAEQVKSGQNVWLIVINHDYEPELLERVRQSGVKVKLINRRQSGRNPLPLLRYNIALWLTRPDIVHFHQVLTSSVTIAVPSIKYVQTVHDTALPIRPRRYISRWFAISESVKADLRSRYGLESEVIYNGIHTSALTAKAGSQGEQDKQPFRIAVVSRLVHEKKGQDIAIEAIVKLQERYPAVELDIIGEGPSLEVLQQMARNHNIEQRVHFPGNQQRQWIYRHLAEYDLLLQPSRHEGFGLTVAEGMAAKVPVLVSDCEGPMEIIGNGRFGHHFLNGSAEDCAQAIASIIHNYPTALQLAQGDAHDHVVANFDISATAAHYLRSYPHK